jgi:hydrogenase assembly chaperone HypC/HupF
MCLSDVARIVRVDPADASAVVDVDGAESRISLAVLALDGALPAAGDWVVVHTGLAVERITADHAATVLATRQAYSLPTTEGSHRP